MIFSRGLIALSQFKPAMEQMDNAVERLTTVKLAIFDAIKLNFGTGPSLVRTGIWSALFLSVSLGLASEVERQYEQAKLAAVVPPDSVQDGERIDAYTFSGLSESELLADSVPRIAIVGASESAGYLRMGSINDNFAVQLAAELEEFERPALLIDFAIPGLNATATREHIRSAISYGADLVVFTSALPGVRTFFGGDEMMGDNLFAAPEIELALESEASDATSTRQVSIGWFDSPTTIVDHALDDWLVGYRAGFRRSFGILFDTAEETAVFAHGVLSEATEGAVRTIELRAETQLPEDKDAVERMRTRPPGDPLERLKLLTGPALDAGVPVLYVVTPVNRSHEYYTSFFQTNYLEFEAEFNEWESILNYPEAGLHYWPAYKGDWESAITFYDAFHLKQASAFIEELAKVVIETGLLADFGLENVRDFGDGAGRDANAI